MKIEDAASAPAPHPERQIRRVRWPIAITVLGLVTAGVVAALAIPNRDAPGHTTPNVAALAGSLSEQQIRWETCSFAADPSFEGIDTSNVQCATIAVPQDWHAVDTSKTWDIRISQATNVDTDAAHYTGTLMLHPGGPVLPGLSQSAITQQSTPELRPTTNFVSFDQRGIGESSSPTCQYPWNPATTDIDAEHEAIAAACAANPEVATMTTEQIAYDMDFIRHLLGLKTVDYLGYSYGTWLGTWYGNLFGDNIGRMVFDSALNTTQRSIQGNYDRQNLAREQQFTQRMLPWIARQDAVHGLGVDPAAIRDQYYTATGLPERTESARLLWYSTNAVIAFSKNVGYTVVGQVVQGLIEDAKTSHIFAEDPVVIANRVLDHFDPAVVPPVLIDAARGRLAAMIEAERPVVDTGELETRSFQSALEFTRCTDGQWDQGVQFWDEYNTTMKKHAPLTAQFGLLDFTPLCAFWPTDSAMPSADDSFPETIVLQSELDALTPWEGGRATGTQLPNTSFIAVDNEGTHGVFPYGSDVVDQPVIEFLLGGERPAQTIVADAHPLPNEDATYENWTALDDEANHHGPITTDPWQSADMAAR